MNLYFDNAATSWPKAPGVAEAVGLSIREGMGNPGRSNAVEPGRVMFAVREALARLINAPDSSRIAFGLNATQMINIGLQGMIRAGDRVVTTSMEHNAVSRPLRYLEKVRCIDLDIIPCSPQGYLDEEALKKALDRSTRLVVINHSSNVTGAVNELKTIGKLVNESGSLLMVDCAQSIGSVEIDVVKDQIDILAGPGHKSLLGPAGTGFLYLSARVSPEPLIYGGTGSRSESDVQPDILPDCYESGTQNIHGLAGLSASLDYIRTTGTDVLQARKDRIASSMLDGLKSIKGIRLFGPAGISNRTLTFSIDMNGREIADLANHLIQHFGIITRTGLHCAPWAHRTAGSYPEGTVRISPGLFHDESDIAFVLDALDRSVRHCQ